MTREPVIIERGRKDNRPGLPRPLARAKGVLRPVPWTNASDWGILQYPRAARCEAHSLCLICGVPVEDGVILTSSKICPVLADKTNLDLAADNGPMHNRCGKMTVAHCAHVRNQLRLGEMFMVPYRKYA